MSTQNLYAGYVRLSELLTRVLDLAKHGEKKLVYSSLNTLIADFDEYVSALAEEVGMTDEDIEKFSSEEASDDVLVKQAGHQPEALKEITVNADKKPGSLL